MVVSGSFLEARHQEVQGFTSLRGREVRCPVFCPVRGFVLHHELSESLLEADGLVGAPENRRFANPGVTHFECDLVEFLPRCRQFRCVNTGFFEEVLAVDRNAKIEAVGNRVLLSVPLPVFEKLWENLVFVCPLVHVRAKIKKGSLISQRRGPDRAERNDIRHLLRCSCGRVLLEGTPPV